MNHLKASDTTTRAPKNLIKKAPKASALYEKRRPKSYSTSKTPTSSLGLAQLGPADQGWLHYIFDALLFEILHEAAEGTERYNLPPSAVIF